MRNVIAIWGANRRLALARQKKVKELRLVAADSLAFVLTGNGPVLKILSTKSYK